MLSFVVLVTPTGDFQDFEVMLFGRSTIIVFSEQDKAKQFRDAVHAAWSPHGWGAGIANLHAQTLPEAVSAIQQMIPATSGDAFVPDTDPAVDELLEWLRAGGRLAGPA